MHVVCCFSIFVLSSLIHVTLKCCTCGMGNELVSFVKQLPSQGVFIHKVERESERYRKKEREREKEGERKTGSGSALYLSTVICWVCVMQNNNYFHNNDLYQYYTVSTLGEKDKLHREFFIITKRTTILNYLCHWRWRWHELIWNKERILNLRGCDGIIVKAGLEKENFYQLEWS